MGTESRYKVFSGRNQAGGDADATYTCPLCAQDGRTVSLSPLPNSPMKGGNSDSFKESVTDFTVSSRMVINPFANSTAYTKKSPSKISFSSPTKAVMQPEKLSSLVGSSSSPNIGKRLDKKNDDHLSPSTPPLRLNSPAVMKPDGVSLLGMDENLHRKAILNRVKNKNW